MMIDDEVVQISSQSTSFLYIKQLVIQKEYDHTILYQKSWTWLTQFWVNTYVKCTAAYNGACADIPTKHQQRLVLLKSGCQVLLSEMGEVVVEYFVYWGCY